MSMEPRPRIDPRAVAIFLLVLGGTTAIGSFGFYLNDEVALGAAAYNLDHGRAHVDVLPPEYWNQSHQALPQIVFANGHGYASEGRGSAVLSFPAYLALEAGTRAIPLDLVFAGIACGAIACGAGLLARSPRARHAWWIAGAVAFVVQVPLSRPLPDVWVAPAALQLTSMIVFALGCACLFAAVRDRHGDRAAGWALGILVLGTTATFWAYGQKYHALESGALMLVLSFRWGGRPSLWRACAAYLIAGLAIWVQSKTGGILAGALVSIDIILLLWRRPRLRRTAPRVAAAALAFLIGVSPAIVENKLTDQAPVIPVLDTPPAGAVAPNASVAARAEGRSMWVLDVIRGQTSLVAPDLIVPSLYASWIYPAFVTAHIDVQFSMIMLSPLIALAPFGIVAARKRLGPPDAFLATHAFAVLIVYAVRAAAPGGGSYDSRYLSILLPALSIYAGVWIAALPNAPWRWIAAIAAAMTCVALAAMAAQHDFTFQFYVIRRMGLLAAIVISLAAIAIAVGRAPRWVAPAALAIGFAATTLFVLQLEIHEAPRHAGNVAHFLPATRMISAALARALGT